MNRLILYYLFISAFIALVLVSAYGLLLAGGKYNGEQLSLEAIYERARSGQPLSVPQQRKIDEDILQKIEMERLNNQTQEFPQEAPADNTNTAPISSPVDTGSDGVPYSGGN